MSSSKRYPIPARQHRVQEEIRRSTFITTIGHAPTVEDARDLISQVSAEFSDASHNCWAYVVGPPGSTSQVGMSDDGEPHGTAGRPMLTVLLHSGVGDVAAVVTRYFGGTLLGKGGLVRAYRGGVKSALESVSRVERIPSAELDVEIDYSSITLFQRMLPDYEAESLAESYGADASYRIKLPIERVAAFQQALAELTNGQAVVEVASVDEG